MKVNPRLSELRNRHTHHYQWCNQEVHPSRAKYVSEKIREELDIDSRQDKTYKPVETERRALQSSDGVKKDKTADTFEEPIGDACLLGRRV